MQGTGGGETAMVQGRLSSSPCAWSQRPTELLGRRNGVVEPNSLGGGQKSGRRMQGVLGQSPLLQRDAQARLAAHR